MERMFKLLSDLTEDPFKHEAFLSDPESFMRESGLTAEEMAELAQLSGSPSTAAANGAWARCAGCIDPGPDPYPDPDPANIEA